MSESGRHNSSFADCDVPMLILIYPAVGALAGLAAGLFGIGGGLIIVPVLVFSFALQGVSEAVAVHLAVGTSLTCIVVSSISSVRAHHALGNVDWHLWRYLAPGIAAGVVVGVNVAAALPGSVMKVVFGVFALIMAGQMMLGSRGEAAERASRLPGPLGLSGVGALIGGLSALFGIGGGSLTVPFLSICGQRMQVAVATAAACGLPIAVVGALGNIVVGWGHADLPAMATGYVYWPAFLGVAVMSIPFAKVGARLAQRLSSAYLTRAFASFLLVVGAYFLYGAL